MIGASSASHAHVLAVIDCVLKPTELDRLVRSASGSALIAVDFVEVVPGETLADVVNARIASGEVAAVAIITAPGEFVRLELERALALLTSEDAPVAVYGGTPLSAPTTCC